MADRAPTVQIEGGVEGGGGGLTVGEAADLDATATATAALAALIASGALSVRLVAGSAVAAHVIVDTAPTTAVTLAALPALVAGTAAIGKLAANSGVDIGDVDVTSVSPPAAAFAAVVLIAAGGTRQALASSQALAAGVEITALHTNANPIFVGITGTVSSSVYGKRLLAGQSVYVPIANLATMFLDGTTGEGVSYLAS